MIRVVLPALLLAAACGKKEETSAPATAPDPAPPSESPARPEPPRQQRSLVGGGQMQHCPTAVANTVTTIAPNASGVELTITAQDPADDKTVKEIRADAKHLADVARKNPSEVKHTGEGEGGGGLGKCPVVLKDTTVTFTEIDGGVKITVVPSKPDQVEWLKAEVQARYQKSKSR